MSEKLQFLRQALYRKRLVRFSDAYDPGATEGYVLGIGQRFLILSVVDETVRLNGFQCLQISDIRRLEVPSRYEKFFTFALRRRNQSCPTKPAIDLSDTASIISSASAAFGLITIHRQRIKPDSCWIGKLVELSESHLKLLEIGPDAEWERRPSRFRLDDITRVDFGGGYEEALELVGGPPPVLEQKKTVR